MTIAGVALTAGSTVVNSMAASKAAKARDGALAAERIRQGTLDQEANAINAQSQDRYKDFEGQQQAEATKLGDYFAGQTTPEPTAAEALPSSGSNITVQEESKQRGQARDFTNKTGEALGNLRSFGDLLGSIGRDQARDASLIGQIGGFKGGSSNVLPFELDEASQKGSGLKLFGDILGGVGGLATSAGLSGQSLFGSTPAVGAKVPVSATRPATQGLRLGSLYGGN